MSFRRIQFAPTVRVEALRPELDEVLREIAGIMVEPGESEEEWLDCCFVSDEARLADFFSDDSDIVLFRERLDLPALGMRDLIRHVALAVRSRKSPKTVHQVLRQSRREHIL